jgi:splicing suppressor protein 51
VCDKLLFAKTYDDLLYQHFKGMHPIYVSPCEEYKYDENNMISGGWYSYLKHRVSPEKRDLFSDMSTSKSLIEQMSMYENELSEPLAAVITENLSFPMTVVFALHQLLQLSADSYQKNLLSVMSFVPRFGKTLIVHIIGAANIPELVGVVKYEEILHCLPHVQTLELILIGPEMNNKTRSTKQTLFGRTMAITCVHGLYHEVVAPGSQQRYLPSHLRRPHLAVAYNCGVHDTADTWTPTIKYLVGNNIPSVFTSFTEDEAAQDGKIISECGANIVYGPAKNPFGSRRLLLDSSIPTGGVFCTNSHITMIHGNE